MRKAAVIGAGVAGLACAARLQHAGFEVTVFDKNEHAGGKMSGLSHSGYYWDKGPSLFTQLKVLEQLFSDCGKDLSAYLEYSTDSGTQYFWDDGTSVHAKVDPGNPAKSICEQLQIPQSALNKYLNNARDSYTTLGSLFLDNAIHELQTWHPAEVIKALGKLKPGYLFKSLHYYNVKELKDPKLVQMMDRLATYNGSDPYRCPAMLSMIAHLEYNEGVWYPSGGMIRIPQALQALCNESGVQFRFAEKVTALQISHTGKIVKTENGASSFDVIVSNSDVQLTYRDLLKDVRMADRFAKMEPSSSGLIFYWGIRKSFPQLRLHNIFFSSDYQQEFNGLFQDKKIAADPTVYINISSKKDPAHAPDACENWFVLVNAPASVEGLNEQAVGQAKRDILRKVSALLGEDVESLIEVEEILRPQDIATDTECYLGALYGSASNNPMAAFKRQSNKSRKYPGLFFAGGTVHPGGGIPLCLRSGKLAAEAVIAYCR